MKEKNIIINIRKVRKRETKKERECVARGLGSDRLTNETEILASGRLSEVS